MENDPFNRATGHNSADDMAEFVDGHHCEPAQRNKRNGEQDLMESLHAEQPRLRYITRIRR